MKLYQLSMTHADGRHAGYFYTPTLAQAKLIKRQQAEQCMECDIMPIFFDEAKSGIVGLLNRYASHPDNG